ncbi:hypothetical protein C8R45DRAFT_916974 [Mycena sanguinolenta]|nr:hypothetical protein C8R45DRAFT_916974 [Mycena sanguinolenta]
MERSAETCGDPDDAIPFYRMLVPNPARPEYYYSADITYVNTALHGGWTLQTVAALMFLTQEESTVPFFRLNSNVVPGEMLFTANTTELVDALQNGYSIAVDDAETYVYPTQICGSVPFYHLYNSAKQANFYTVSTSEMQTFIANGYSNAGIAGYVLPVGGSECD